MNGRQDKIIPTQGGDHTQEGGSGSDAPCVCEHMESCDGRNCEGRRQSRFCARWYFVHLRLDPSSWPPARVLDRARKAGWPWNNANTKCGIRSTMPIGQARGKLSYTLSCALARPNVTDASADALATWLSVRDGEDLDDREYKEYRQEWEEWEYLVLVGDTFRPPCCWSETPPADASPIEGDPDEHDMVGACEELKEDYDRDLQSAGQGQPRMTCVGLTRAVKKSIGWPWLGLVSPAMAARRIKRFVKRLPLW